MKRSILLSLVVVFAWLAGCNNHSQVIAEEPATSNGEEQTGAASFFSDIFNTDSTIYGGNLASEPFDMAELKAFLSGADSHRVLHKAYSDIDEYWKGSSYFAIYWHDGAYTVCGGVIENRDIALKNGFGVGSGVGECESLFGCRVGRDTMDIIDESEQCVIRCYFKDGKVAKLAFWCGE